MKLFGDDKLDDFIALKGHDFDAEHILVPTAGGPSSELSAEIARDLQNVFGSTVTLLHVSEDIEEGVDFLKAWAADHGLDDANLRVETGDINVAIATAAEDCSMAIIGATGGGLITRVLRGSPVLDVVDEVERSVMLTERARRRSLRERLFGTQK